MTRRPNTAQRGSVRLCRRLLGALLVAGLACRGAPAQEAAQPDPPPEPKPAARPAAEPTAEQVRESDQAGPKIRIDNPTHDFGEVWVSPTLNHTFMVRNVGNEVLKITKVKPSCGCTLMGAYDQEISPGGVGKIPLKLKTRGLKKFKKSVTITCNDPDQPTQRVFLAGHIKYYVSADPLRVNFLRIRADEQVKQVVDITVNAEEAKLELEGDGKAGKFQAALVQGRAPNQYQLIVEGLPPFNPRSNTAKFVIKTGVPQQPRLEIPVSAYVPERLEIRPAQLIIPRSSPKPSQRYVMVTNNGDTPVEVLAATVSNEEITAAITAQEQGKRYRITLALPADYMPPPDGDKLVLKLLDGTEKEHIVPIRSHLKRPDQPKKRERPAMTLLGKPAPKAVLHLRGGDSYAVGASDDITVLNFYATWCGFSKRQAPDVEKVYQEFKDNPKVRVISVSQDRPEGKRGRTPEEVIASFEERGLTHGLALDPATEVGTLFKAVSYPTLFVLKGDKIEAVHIGAKQNLAQTVIGEVQNLLEGKPLAPAEVAKERPAEQGTTTPPSPKPQTPKKKRERPAMSLLGRPAPKTELKLHDGETYQVGTGEDIVVLNFYATWCGFSRKQAPDVEKIHQAFKDNPKVRVISVSEDRSEGRRARPPEQVVSSFKERGLTHDLVLDPSTEVGQRFKAISYPTLFVLKGEKVEAVHIGAKPALDRTVISEINDLLGGKSLAPAVGGGGAGPKAGAAEPAQAPGDEPKQPSTGGSEAAPPSPIAMPVNGVDPMTNKPVRRGSPTTLYKGQVIGFCCANSPAAKGGWDRMSEADKDAFLARFAETTVQR